MRFQITALIGGVLAAAAFAAAQQPAPVRAPAKVYAPELRTAMHDLQDRAEEARVKAEEMRYGAFEGQSLAFMAQADGFGYGSPKVLRTSSEDNLYERGQRALDRGRWEEALDFFGQVAQAGGTRTDAALYWTAYSQNKLGRREQALATIAKLRSSQPNSRWLNDAKALEMEVKQASGQPVSPESQTDDDLKLMALNALMQSNPERAIQALDGLLKGAESPRLKQRALFVLAQSSSPNAQRLLEQVARGAGNPDLQVRAIAYLGVARRRKGQEAAQPANGNLLSEIYTSSSDPAVKRAVLNALASNRDSDRLLQTAKSEKNAELKLQAIRALGSIRAAGTADSLAALYGPEQDKEVKRSIISSLASQDNVKQLIAIGRAERDPEIARYLVGRLADMKSPEATDYLMEILKR